MNVMPEFELLRPTSLDEALAALAARPGARLCAGGTDLLANMRRGLVAAPALIDLARVDVLHVIEQDDTGLTVGAGVSLAALLDADLDWHGLNALREALVAVAGPTHRQVATIGGNLCQDTRCLYYNQSEWWRQSNDFCLKYRGEICHVAPRGNRCRAAYCGDLAPALMVLGAEVELAGPQGRRRISLAELFVEDGAAHLNCAPDEILVGVHVPPDGLRSTYGKIRQRGAIDFPLAGVAVSCRGVDGGLRFLLAVTGTNSCPVMVEVGDPLLPDTTPDAFFRNISRQVQKAVSPQRTTSIAPHYRRLSVAALAARLARDLAGD